MFFKVGRGGRETKETNKQMTWLIYLRSTTKEVLSQDDREAGARGRAYVKEVTFMLIKDGEKLRMKLGNQKRSYRAGELL